MKAPSFSTGQRYVSDSEPELGMGIVMEVSARDVLISFPSSGEDRRYRKDNTPLQRVSFRPGDHIHDIQNRRETVTAVEKQGALLVYRCGERLISETELSGKTDFRSVRDKLAHGRFGHNRDFDIRRSTLEHRHRIYASRCRGLLGPRIELLEHQVYIASEIASHGMPRALLADEVGLGKTIEAGLVFHKLFTTDRIHRVLIITPPALVNQWLVEMYRRFNHMFSIAGSRISEGGKPAGKPPSNPFTDNSTVICSLDDLVLDSSFLNQACREPWHLLIVDEAHHLQWSEAQVSSEYSAVQRLSESAEGLLLLTATPAQLGEKSHFGRLKLLNPYRFNSFKQYESETAGYRQMAVFADKVTSGTASQSEILSDLESLFPGDLNLIALGRAVTSKGKVSREKLLQALIDRHGTGRMVYRNRSSVVKGFPGRRLHEIRLESNEQFNGLIKELQPNLVWSGAGTTFDPFIFTPAHFNLPQAAAAGLLKKLWHRDPRLIWLKDFLTRLKTGEKVLLICGTAGKVLALQQMLPEIITFPFSVFHEHLSLSTRDKNAADFTMRDGIRLLITSEMGSEGRNFQLAHHLVLFDIPVRPGTLEQRIGRLHRIGRNGEVDIWVPYIAGTPAELLFNWHHRGLNSFLAPAPGADSIHGELKDRLESLSNSIIDGSFSKESLDADFSVLIQDTARLVQHYGQVIETGRDRLLELNSLQADEACDLIEDIRVFDSSQELRFYLETVFESFGIQFFPTAEERGFIVSPGPETTVEAFPGLPQNGMPVTFSRSQALVREDMAFLTWEHPLVTGAMELVLGNTGNFICIAEWMKAPEAGLLFEVIFILEPVKAKAFDVFKYLPPTPIRLVIDHKGNLRPELMAQILPGRLKPGPGSWPHELADFRKNQLPELLESAHQEATRIAEHIRKDCVRKIRSSLQGDIDYYAALGQAAHANREICAAKALHLKKEMDGLATRISEASIQTDSFRMIIMKPA